MKRYDLRSDTFTLPDDGMRQAIAGAEVGNDEFGEDTTVNRLEKEAASITGKEAALFVNSGTMGNLIPLYINGGRGNEVICHRSSHILYHEAAGITALAGVLPKMVEGERGVIKPQQMEPLLQVGGYGASKTKLIVIENTHNQEGGVCWSKPDLLNVRNFADRHGLSVHMDGARIFNAAAATSLSVGEIASCCDTVTFCLSKGLGAPVGALLCGRAEFIEQARTLRKMLGGQMRQAGIVAAAGLYALEHNVERLAEDHENARQLAMTLEQVEWAGIDIDRVETNIIYLSTSSPASVIVKQLAERGVLCFDLGERMIRFVTSMLVNRQDIREVCDILSAFSPE